MTTGPETAPRELRFFGIVLKRSTLTGPAHYFGQVGEGWRARDVSVHYNPAWTAPHGSEQEHPSEWVAQFGSLAEARGPSPRDAIKGLEQRVIELSNELRALVE